ncbi:MAG: cbb3-type cytochrome c oxidase subunit I, partial [Nitriliruptor sp.]
MAQDTVTARSTGASRLRSASGWAGWLATTDHKKVGILYLFTTFVFFFLGGVEAWLIRLQLAQAEAGVISEAVYNQVFTMHGITMVFLVVMPLGAAFFNYLIP